MRIAHLLLLLLALHVLVPHALPAEEGGQVPLQLAPGSGIQPPASQAVPPPPPPMPGQGPATIEQEPLRDIHPPLPLPEEPDYRITAAGLLLLLLVFALIFWFFRQKRKKRQDKLVPAHETALAELLQLRRAMSPEQALLYAGELADILRRYIEKRFLIRTSRQTTREFFASLSENPARYARLLEDHGDALKRCLEQCDMAKFAHCPPDRHGMEEMEAAVRGFIESSREQRERGES